MFISWKKGHVYEWFIISYLSVVSGRLEHRLIIINSEMETECSIIVSCDQCDVLVRHYKLIHFKTSL